MKHRWGSFVSNQHSGLFVYIFFRNKRETLVKISLTKPLEPFALEYRLAEKQGRWLWCFQMFQEMSTTQEIGELESLAWVRARDKSIVLAAEICFYRPCWVVCKYILKPVPSQQGTELWAEVLAVLLIACCSLVILTTSTNRFALLQCFLAISKVITWRWQTWTETWL